MDWDLKAPASWDLAELEHADAAAAPGPSSSGVHHVNAVSAGGCRVPAGNGGGGRAECSVDLKLGGLGGCELGHGAADRRSGEPAAAAAAPAPPTAGAGANRWPRPSCAVDGCKADLAKCRDYHRRHKVCEAHSKTPVVVVAGSEMRFCQQCSRFHLLAEFDETKRSCRKRLDGHNRRRRKPQPDPMTTASFLTSQQGTRFSPFTITTPRLDATWAGIIKTEESPYYAPQILQEEGGSNRQHFGVGSTPAYGKEGRRFPFLQEGGISFATEDVALEAAASAVCQPLLKTVAAPPESGGGGSKVDFSDALSRVLDSDCALSLLSAPANSSGVDVGRMVRPTEQVPPMAPQPLVSGLQFGGSPSWFPRPHQAAAAAATAATGMVSEQQQQLTTVLGGASDGVVNYNGVFHVGGEGSSDGTSSSLPFAWQ